MGGSRVNTKCLSRVNLSSGPLLFLCLLPRHYNMNSHPQPHILCQVFPSMSHNCTNIVIGPASHGLNFSNWGLPVLLGFLFFFSYSSFSRDSVALKGTSRHSVVSMP